MDTRQQTLLKLIVEGYLTTAQPISSKYLAEKNHLPVSTATIRNEMAELEEEGLIYQPHTSAGRIPTVDGLRYYVDHIVQPTSLSKRDEKHFASIFSTQGLKGVAREGAHFCRSACIISYDNTDLYYTGFSQLFSQPEFMDIERMQAISEVIDRIENTLPAIAAEITNEPRVYLGSNNPLGESCTAIFIANDSRRKTIFGFLSPVRTDYAKTIGTLASLLRFLTES